MTAIRLHTDNGTVIIELREDGDTVESTAPLNLSTPCAGCGQYPDRNDIWDYDFPTRTWTHRDCEAPA